MNLWRPLTCLLALSLITPITADDWPQYRGPNRDARSAETGLLQEWPEAGPKLLWSKDDLGIGYAGPSIVGDRLYTCVGRKDGEYLIALDLAAVSEGKAGDLWATKIGPVFTWEGNAWNAGPNIAPTVDGDLVFALGGFGDLICANAKSGEVVWRLNLPEKLGGEVNPIGGGLSRPTPLGWGYAGAPLVDGDRLICVPGGKRGQVAALDKKTGELLWQSKEAAGQATYSAPMIAEFGGVRQYVQLTHGGMIGVKAENGELLWEYERGRAYQDVVISAPLVADGSVYASAGFGEGCDLVRVTSTGGKFSAKAAYSKKAFQSRDGGVVLVDGHVYGYSETGGWACQNLRSGEIVWSDRRSLGRGSIAFADGRLYCRAESGGEVVLLEPSTKGWSEKGRFTLPKESDARRPSGRAWTHPVIADGKLYLRDQSLLFCYDISK